MSLRNLSLFGLSNVTLTFDDGVDALFARAQVLERLRDAELPPSVTPALGPLATPIGEIYRYTLSGAGGDPMQLRTLQDWLVQPRLLRVQGVADVVSYGGLVREVHVQPSPGRLAAYGLTLEELETALEKASQNASGGILERGAEQLVIRSQGLFSRMEDIPIVPVASARGDAGAGARRRHRQRRLGAAAGSGQSRRSSTTRSKASSSCAAARTPARSCSACAKRSTS